MVQRIEEKPAIITKTSEGVLPQTPAPVNLVWAIYEFGISEIINNGHLLSQKATQQIREQKRVDTEQKNQKGRYDASAKWSFAKVLDGTIKAGGLFVTGYALNALGNAGLLQQWTDVTPDQKSNIINGASSIVGQFSGAMEGKHQARIQTTGASEIEAARLKQTAVSDDKRRTDDYASSSNQTFLQALHQAAEAIKPR